MTDGLYLLVELDMLTFPSIPVVVSKRLLPGSFADSRSNLPKVSHVFVGTNAY